MAEEVMITLAVSLVSTLIIILLSALMLWITGKLFKITITYLQGIIAAVIVEVSTTIIGLIAVFSESVPVVIVIAVINFLVGVALYLTLPKFLFNLEWSKGLLVGLVWFGFMIAVSLVMLFVSMILAFIFGVTLASPLTGAAFV